MDRQHLPRPARAAAFIAAARQLHGDRYGYDDVASEYVNGKERVPIYCRRHARVFRQAPHDHLKGQGCPDCGGRRWASADARRSSFLTKAEGVHRGRYRYDPQSFTAANQQVRIECPQHGWFTQRATNHLQGQGCPSCRLPRQGRSRR